MMENERKNPHRLLHITVAYLLGALSAGIVFALAHTHDDTVSYGKGVADGFAQCDKPSRIERIGKFLGE